MFCILTKVLKVFPEIFSNGLANLFVHVQLQVATEVKNKTLWFEMIYLATLKT